MASSPSSSSSFDDFDDDSFEHTLLVVREVSVFKIPPRSTSGGYKCGEWLQSDKIWSGRLRVVSCKSRAEIRLEDPISGDLFAACHVYPGLRDQSVEPALDSSRYFVLKIEDGTGKHAFIGLGFAERNEAFDFNVALSDHEKHVKRESEKEGSAAAGSEGDENSIDIHPAVNHRLKEGETIRINVKHKLASGTGMLSSGKSVGLAPPPNGSGNLKPLGLAPPPSGSGNLKPLGLAPPPSGSGYLKPLGLAPPPSGSGNPKPLGLAPPPSGSGKIRSALPPPPNDPAVTRMTSKPKGSKESARHAVDPLSDFSQLEKNLPSKAGSGTTNGSAAGWAAF